AGRSKPLEIGRGAKAKQLGPIVRGLEQGLREVRAKRTKRRLPNEAHAGRHTDVHPVVDEASFLGDGGFSKTTRYPQRTGIDKHGALHAEIVRHEGKREAGFR